MGPLHPGAYHCALALATLAGGKTGVSVHSILLLDSLSFWFLLGRGRSPLLVPMGWSILECLGEPGEAAPIMGGWDEKVYTYFRR